MTDSEDRLLGYLLGDCDARERDAVERLVSNSPDVRRKLGIVRTKYAVLLSGFPDVDPPAGLFQSTCDEMFFGQSAETEVAAMPAAQPQARLTSRVVAER